MKYLLVAAFAVVASTSVNAAGNASAGQGKAAVCAACHGADGISTGPTFPNLAGQKEAYIVACLLYTSPSPRDKRQSRMPSSA